MYSEWKKEYEIGVGLRNTTSGGGSGGIGDPTASQAMRLKELSDRIEMIEQTARDADPTIYKYILMGVTIDHMTFERLKGKGLPCERKMYYDRRRKFYYLMSIKLHI